MNHVDNTSVSKLEDGLQLLCDREGDTQLAASCSDDGAREVNKCCAFGHFLGSVEK